MQLMEEYVLTVMVMRTAKGLVYNASSESDTHLFGMHAARPLPLC